MQSHLVTRGAQSHRIGHRLVGADHSERSRPGARWLRRQRDDFTNRQALGVAKLTRHRDSGDVRVHRSCCPHLSGERGLRQRARKGDHGNGDGGNDAEGHVAIMPQPCHRSAKASAERRREIMEMRGYGGTLRTTDRVPFVTALGPGGTARAGRWLAAVHRGRSTRSRRRPDGHKRHRVRVFSGSRSGTCADGQTASCRRAEVATPARKRTLQRARGAVEGRARGAHSAVPRL